MILCVMELETTSLTCGSNSDLVSLENPTPTQASDPDLLDEQAIIFFVEFWTQQLLIVTTMWAVYIAFVLTVRIYP